MVECKSLNQSHDKDNDIFYKINAIQGKFGRLAAKSFLVSTAISNILDIPKQNINNNSNSTSEYKIKETVSTRGGELKTVIIHPFKFAKNLKDEIRQTIDK